MKNYQKFIQQFKNLEKEKERIEKLYMEEFTTDVENEIIKNGGIKERIDPKSLHIREKDTNGVFSTIEDEIIDVYWIYNKDCGIYLSPLDMFLSFQVYGIIKNVRNEMTFKCIIDNLKMKDNLLNDKRIDMPDMIRKYVKNLRNDAIKTEYKRDIKNYNL